MPSSNICWGIEIGAAAIKAIKLEAVGDGRVKVLDYAVVQHPKVLSTPGVDANDVLRVSLGALTSQYDLSKAAIAVSVPGHSAFARFAKLPPVDPKKVPDIVKFEAMQQIPFPLENVEWDYQTFVSPDSPDVEVGIFAITREKVNERLTMLADVGIFPNFVVLSPIAVYNALAYDLEFDQKTPGTIIVDVGTTSTDLVIATPGRVWVRTFHIGGHQFTEALVNQFQLSYPKAEKLKRDAEDTKHARQVFQALRPVFTDLTQEIQRSIGYYQSINKDAQLNRLIGVGSTFLLPGLRKYLKQQLSMDVYRVDAQTPFKRVTVEGDKAPVFQELSTSMCTAYGLALQGLGLNAVGGNLMPTAVLRKAMWKDKVGWFGLAAGVAGLASAVMFVRPVRDHFEIMGRTANAVVAQTQSKGSELINNAKAEGVANPSESDMRAANLVALLDKREAYDLIAWDLAQVFEAGDKLAPTWASALKNVDGTTPPTVPPPAFSMTSFDTNYSGPGGGFDPNTGMAPAVADPSAGDSSFPRITCRLVMTTAQPDPRRFVNKSIEEWFKANAKRADVPYVITDAKFSTELKDAPVLEAAAAPAPTGEQGGPMRGGLRQAGRVFGEGGGGTPVPAPAAPDAGQSDLDTLAPLVQPPDGAPPTTGVVTVTWTVVFRPAAPAAENGGTK